MKPNEDLGGPLQQLDSLIGNVLGQYRDGEVVGALEENPKIWRPALAKVARLAEKITQKRPRPSSPPSPGLPNGITRPPPGDIANNSDPHKELGLLVQAYNNESSSGTSKSTPTHPRRAP